MDEATFQEMMRKRVVYSLPGMESVGVRKDVRFKSINDLVLKMDVYTPDRLKPGERRTAVIFVSGGDETADTVRTREIGLYISYGQLLAASGLIGIVFDHRGVERYTQLREVGEDTDDLVDYVRTNAAELGADAERLCIWAFSTGPLYGLCTAFRNTSAVIRCAIAYYGGMTLLDKRFFTYSSEEVSVLQEFSPIHYLRTAPEGIPPLFIARAGLDRPFLNESIDEFVQLAVANKVPITLMTHPAGLHGFDMLNNDARSREIICATLGFIKTYLSAGAEK